MNNATQAYLQVKDIHVGYGRVAVLEGVSLEVPRGGFVAIVGSNGAGKSTTMKIITGYLAADSGTVSVLGENALANPKKLAAQIGYLPENNPLYLDSYVREFLEFSGGIYGMKSADIRRRTE